jgi:hypothetical protein
VCDNGPDDGPGDDPTIITNCWLGRVDTSDPELAKRSALSGRAIIIRLQTQSVHQIMTATKATEEAKLRASLS